MAIWARPVDDHGFRAAYASVKRYYPYGERTVHLDGRVEVEAACYSVPPGFIGQRVSGGSGTSARCTPPRWRARLG